MLCRNASCLKRFALPPAASPDPNLCEPYCADWGVAANKLVCSSNNANITIHGCFDVMKGNAVVARLPFHIRKPMLPVEDAAFNIGVEIIFCEE